VKRHGPLHDPPAQLVSQLPLVLQVKVQLPPGQSNVQLASPRHVMSQVPPSQVKWQVALSVQVTSHTPPRQEASQLPADTQVVQPPLMQSVVQTSPPSHEPMVPDDVELTVVALVVTPDEVAAPAPDDVATWVVPSSSGSTTHALMMKGAIQANTNRVLVLMIGGTATSVPRRTSRIRVACALRSVSAPRRTLSRLRHSKSR
jgi:hypothetical protein